MVNYFVSATDECACVDNTKIKEDSQLEPLASLHKDYGTKYGTRENGYLAFVRVLRVRRRFSRPCRSLGRRAPGQRYAPERPSNIPQKGFGVKRIWKRPRTTSHYVNGYPRAAATAWAA